MNEINRMRQLAGLSMLNESFNGPVGHESEPDIEALKNKTRQESIRDRSSKHLNLLRSGGYQIEDWYDGENTIASYENGRPIGVTTESFKGPIGVAANPELVGEDESETQTQSTAAVDSADSEFDAAEEGDELVEAYDFHNGYDDIHYADEFFKYPNFGIPTGADGPVVKKTGAAGARHGDNPEQKYMSISEDIHKELVYKYRDFLKESGTFDLKKKLSEELNHPLSIKLEEIYGTWDADSDNILYSGPITVHGTGLDKHGDPVKLAYSILVVAYSDVEWESAESPTGMNPETDVIDYSAGQSATLGGVTARSGILNYPTNGSQIEPFVDVNGTEYGPEEGLSLLHPTTVKKITSPATYSVLLTPAFDDQLSKISAPTDESIW